MPEPHPSIVPIIEEAGFGGVAKLRHLKVDHGLVTALVERWRPETHTFHFPTRECTITLQDVSLQLGLPIDGPPIIGPTMLDWDEMCETLLGIIPVKGESIIGSMIKLKWLRDNLFPIDENSGIEVIHAYARACILGLIRGVLMPDKTGNKVHLMYLNYLTNLRRSKRYSWGSTCLAVLYREMCRATDGRARTMGGCASLLQSWAWFRMPFIAPISRVSPTFPLVCQWTGG